MSSNWFHRIDKVPVVGTRVHIRLVDRDHIIEAVVIDNRKQPDFNYDAYIGCEVSYMAIGFTYPAFEITHWRYA